MGAQAGLWSKVSRIIWMDLKNVFSITLDTTSYAGNEQVLSMTKIMASGLVSFGNL